MTPSPLYSHLNTPAFDLSGLTPEAMHTILKPIDPSVYEKTIAEVVEITNRNIDNAAKWNAILHTLNTTLEVAGAVLRIAKTA